MDRNSPRKIWFDSIFPNNQLLIDAISVRAIPIAVKIIFVYNSSVDQKLSIFTSQYSSKLFFSIKRFSTAISFNRRTLESFILFTTIFLFTTSKVIYYLRLSDGTFILFYSPFWLEKDVQYCTQYTVLAQ